MSLSLRCTDWGLDVPQILPIDPLKEVFGFQAGCLLKDGAPLPELVTIAPSSEFVSISSLSELISPDRR